MESSSESNGNSTYNQIPKTIEPMPTIIRLIRTWKLPVAMIIGVLLYYLFDVIMPERETRDAFYYVISHIFQPTLIFAMLLLSFLKVEPRNLKPHRWHGILLLTQGTLFVIFSLLALQSERLSMFLSCLLPDIGFTHSSLKLLCEGAMLCFICPTATASAVIVQKLGGSLSGDVTYIVLCNLMVSLLAPGFLTLVEPHAGLDFLTEFFMIMGKVFPLLLCPLFVALIIRHYTPTLKSWLLAIPDLAFYMWLVALALAITVTVRTIVESHTPLGILFSLALVSAVCCVAQFRLGRKIGRRWPQPRTVLHSSSSRPDNLTSPSSPLSSTSTHIADIYERSAVTAGQAFGQKNTVFIIWMGLVFLNPVTSVVGGFYSLWHNIINSRQLYQREKSLSEK